MQQGRLGRRVMVSSRELPERGGCYAEFISVPADAPFLLPNEISDTAACRLGNFQLAQAMLLGVPAIQPLRSILLQGAAGGVATAVAHLAASHGITVIGTASTPAKRAHALAHGVSALVDPEPEGLPQRVMNATAGRGVDLAFDHVGDRLLIACIRSLAPLGTAVSYNIAGGSPSEDVFQELRALLTKSLAVHAFSIHTFDSDRSQRRDLMDKAMELMRNAAVKAPPTSIYGLHQVREVHELLNTRGSLSKIVLLP